MSVATVRTRIAYLLLRGGWPAWLGLLCLAAVIAYYFLEVLPAFNKLAEVRERKEVLTVQQATIGGTVKRTAPQQLEDFYRDFPVGTSVPDVLAGINQMAMDQQLALEFGEYAMSREQGARLDQLHITLPIKGHYVQVRKFIAEVMIAHPALALEILSVRREKASQDGIEGRVVFSLFVEHSP